jgi:hypothetical protein
MERAVQQDTKYLLANHAFLCIAAGDAIFLDLRADRYLGLPRSQVQQLSGLIRGWPQTPIDSFDDDPGIPRGFSEPLVSSLVERGLIIPNYCAGKDATPVSFPEPTEEIDADTWGGSTSISLTDLTQFASASLSASVRLRLRTMEDTVRYVRARKRCAPTSDTYSKNFLARAISVFVCLRPFVFTSRDQCLLESLVLIEFLSRKGIHPSWVFAVRSNPFSAHCWLQLGSVVLNDTIEHIQSFTPIMVV